MVEPASGSTEQYVDFMSRWFVAAMRAAAPTPDDPDAGRRDPEQRPGDRRAVSHHVRAG